MGEKIGLVLEGGGFRGLFTEGVLEQMLDNGIHLPYVIGVSMGSIEGSCYISKQKRRNYDIAMTYLDDERYVSMKNMVTKGGVFGMDFMFNELAYDLVPFDFETFHNSDQELVVGAMSCHSGLTDYFYKSKLTEKDLLKVLEASCSLPFIQRMVPFKGLNYLDGGVSDSIPYRKAFEDGCDKVVVILTRDEHYVRGPFKQKSLSKIFYRDYPAVTEAMASRQERYQHSIVELEKLRIEGKAMIIRPPKAVNLERVEKNREKLMQTYKMGYEQGGKIMHELRSFVGSKSMGTETRKYSHF